VHRNRTGRTDWRYFERAMKAVMCGRPLLADSVEKQASFSLVLSLS